MYAIPTYTKENSIDPQTMIVVSGIGGDEQADVALKRMNSVLLEASHTVDDLLMFARLEAGTELSREPVRLDFLVESLLPDDSPIQLIASESIANVDPRLATVGVRNLIQY